MTADDAAYARARVRVGRVRLGQLVLGGAGKPAGTGRAARRRHARQRRRRAAATAPSSTGSRTPMPVWNPDLPDPIDYLAQWTDVPDNEAFDNGFKAQWELFLPAARRRAAVPLGPGRRRQGRAACRARPAVLGQGRGSPSRRWRSEMGAQITLPGRPAARVPAPGWLPAIRRRPRGASTPRRTSPPAGRQHRLGLHAGVPRAPVAARVRRRRGHGHRPARHGTDVRPGRAS